MNNVRRKEIEECIDLLKDKEAVEDAVTRLEFVLFDEESAYDNTPENLLSSARALNSEDAINALQEAIDRLNDYLFSTDLKEEDWEDATEEAINILGIIF